MSIPYARAKILFGKIADLSQGIRDRDSLLVLREARIENLKQGKAELTQALDLREQMINNQLSQISNLKQINKNTKKIWLRRALYGACGGLAAGVVAGVLIR